MKDLLRCLAFASLLLPVAVLGNVVFPTNPQTRAECDGPATQLRAMSQAEHDKAVALMREENKIHLTMECASDRRCEANYYAQHHDYYLRISAHFRERDRLSNLRYKLETQCRRIARANEKVTEATIQAEQERQRSMMQRARDAYHKMKQNYERVKALGKNLTESDKLSLQADMQEADSSMADLNDTMDDAKRLILDPVPNHPIVRGFQDSAFKKFKQQMFNTRRAVNQYEQMMEAFQPDSEPTQEAQEDDSPFMRRSGGSATNLFRGDPGGKQAADNAAAKRKVKADIAETNAALQKTADQLRDSENSSTQNLVRGIEVATAGSTGDQSSGDVSSGGSAAVGSGPCRPDPGLVQKWKTESWKLTKYTKMPKATDASFQKAIDYWNNQWSFGSSENLQKDLDRMKADLANFKSQSVQSHQIRAQSRVSINLLECVVKKVKARELAEKRGTTNNTARRGECSFAGFDGEIANFTKTHPQKPSWGMRDTYQYSYYFGTEGLKILEKYKSCITAAQYNENHEVLLGARDKGLEGCQKTSSDMGANCHPVYPN